jgi:hypothetical protein
MPWVRVLACPSALPTRSFVNQSSISNTGILAAGYGVLLLWFGVSLSNVTVLLDIAPMPVTRYVGREAATDVFWY